jgi:hypothetical protein
MKYKLTYMAPSIFVYECATYIFNTLEEAKAKIPELLKEYPPRQKDDYIKIEKVGPVLLLKGDELRGLCEKK